MSYGWRGDPDGHKRAGQAGGKKTFTTHGKEWYSKIGTLGGLISPTKFKKNDFRAVEAGKKGGAAKRGRGT